MATHQTFVVMSAHRVEQETRTAQQGGALYRHQIGARTNAVLSHPKLTDGVAHLHDEVRRLPRGDASGLRRETTSLEGREEQSCVCQRLSVDARVLLKQSFASTVEQYELEVDAR